MPSDPQTTAGPFGLKNRHWKKALRQEVSRLRVVRRDCDHSAYKDFATYGRCCPNCGTFMVDFGD